MGLDMYLTAKKYLDGGWMHVRSDYLHEAGKPAVITPKDPKPQAAVVFDEIIATLGFGTYDEWIKRFPEARSGDISLRVAYWRKANAIHAWFVRTVQEDNDNCAEYEVERSELEELRDICQRIIDASNLGEPVEHDGPWGAYTEYPDVKIDSKLANTLLPPQAGFFFGGTELDAWYLTSLQETVTQLDAVLKDPILADGWTFTYQSSW